MPRKSNASKSIQKSINLTEREWAIIEKTGEELNKSNSAIVKGLIKNHVFFSQLLKINIKEVNSMYGYFLLLSENKFDEKNAHEKSLADLLSEYPQLENYISTHNTEDSK